MLGFITSLPAWLVCLVVFAAVGVESMGVPVPGETILIAAALLSVAGDTPVWAVALAAAVGAILGDGVGYWVGSRYGERLFAAVGRRFPRHAGPEKVAKAVRFFDRYGAWAVMFGRFIAVLRIFAGPIAGWLGMRYRNFLAANAAGAVVWAGSITALVWLLGESAKHVLHHVAWIGLAVAVAVIAAIVLVKWRARRRVPKDRNDLTVVVD